MTNPEDSRRVRLIRTTPQGLEVLINVLNKAMSYTTQITSLPPDIKVLGIRHEEEIDALWIKIYHPSFEPVPEGHAVPELDWKFQTDRRGVSAHDMVELLTEAHKLDPAVMDTLFTIKRQCNKGLADHPTIVCSSVDDKGPFWLGFLGLLNGMLAKIGTDPMLVARIVDDEKGLMGFVARPQSSFQPEPVAPPAETAQPV